MGETALEITELRKVFGDHEAVKGFSLDVKQGEFLSLLGPSGCGKSTILRMVAGLIEPSGGRIVIGGRDVTWQPPNRRNIGLVFQSYALFPHMSVFENVAFGLRRKKVPQKDISPRVEEALALVRLTGLEHRLPRELSGGQQQRVALARAVAPRPALLLLDEPLSNLDAKLRDAMRLELRRLQKELSVTTVFVTHDQEEALTMSDRICVLSDGEHQQTGTPREVYSQPSTKFVAEFFGRSNAFTGSLVEGGEHPRVSLEGGLMLSVAHVPEDVNTGDQVRVIIRQENVDLCPAEEGSIDGNGKVNCFPATMVVSSFAGRDQQYLVRIADTIELASELRIAQGKLPSEVSGKLEARIAADDVIVMAEDQ